MKFRKSWKFQGYPRYLLRCNGLGPLHRTPKKEIKEISFSYRISRISFCHRKSEGLSSGSIRVPTISVVAAPVTPAQTVAPPVMAPALLFAYHGITDNKARRAVQGVPPDPRRRDWRPLAVPAAPVRSRGRTSSLSFCFHSLAIYWLRASGPFLSRLDLMGLVPLGRPRQRGDPATLAGPVLLFGPGAAGPRLSSVFIRDGHGNVLRPIHYVDWGTCSTTGAAGRIPKTRKRDN